MDRNAAIHVFVYENSLNLSCVKHPDGECLNTFVEQAERDFSASSIHFCLNNPKGDEIVHLADKSNRSNRGGEKFKADTQLYDILIARGSPCIKGAEIRNR